MRPATTPSCWPRLSTIGTRRRSRLCSNATARWCGEFAAAFLINWHGSIGTEPRNAEQRPASLKGAWRVVSVNGGEGAFAVFKNSDLVFVGERLLAVSSDPEDIAPATVYRVHLGANRPIHEIDLYQESHPGETRVLGLYEVQVDELRVCLSARRGTRSTTLEPTKTQALVVARRLKEQMPVKGTP